jgi:hypothetical protein
MADTTNKIAGWDKDPANNDSAAPAGAPEGMVPSAVNNVMRENMAVTRTQWNDAEWFEYRDGTPDGTYTYVGTNQFKVTGADSSAHYHVGRRVKVMGSSTGTIVANITAVGFAGSDTTVTIDDSGLINESLVVYTGILSAANPSMPNASTSIKGAVQLYDDSDSTSTVLAPTANALKEVKDASNDATVTSFTPEFADASSGGNKASFSTQKGSYTVRNGRCYIQIALTNINTSGMTSGNDVYITGLPFTSRDDILNYAVGSINMSSVTFSGQVAPIIPHNANYIRLAETGSGVSADYIRVSEISSGVADIWLSINYEIA